MTYPHWRAGDIGPDRREITIEPLPETAPVPEPVPERREEPVPA
jgi:hypothetical protein